MAKRRRRNSFKKSMNGRYQIKRAMHHGRVKAKYKRQAKQVRKNPEYDFEKDQIIWKVMVSIFILFLILMYFATK